MDRLETDRSRRRRRVEQIRQNGADAFCPVVSNAQRYGGQRIPTAGLRCWKIRSASGIRVLADSDNHRRQLVHVAPSGAAIAGVAVRRERIRRKPEDS